MNIEKINNTSLRINNIKDNDKVFIGGSWNSLDMAVTVDTGYFEEFFLRVQKGAMQYENNEKMKEWLKKQNINIDPKIFANMFAFDKVLRLMYPNLSYNISNRIAFYKDGNKTLSQAVEAGVCACAEISILAQLYFQRQKIKTKYFGGELLRSFDEEFAEKHSFIEMKIKGKDYFYDPANPNHISSGVLPRISVVDSNQKKLFDERMHTQNNGRNCAFVKAVNILIPSDSYYYGYGDGCNILPSFIISQNQKFVKAKKNLNKLKSSKTDNLEYIQPMLNNKTRN